MSKGMKTCNECQHEYPLKLNKCPECGTEFQRVLKQYSHEALLCDKPIIYVGYDSKCISLRVAGRPTTYHSTWQSVFKEVSHTISNHSNYPTFKKLVAAEIKAMNRTNKLILTIPELIRSIPKDSLPVENALDNDA